MGRYCTRLLEVDLTRSSVNTRELDEATTRKFIGGVGVAAKILWGETTKNTEAFSPENPLLFMGGPLTGLVPSSSRYVVAAISPLTGIWGEAHSGGNWPDELKHAGFDGIVVRGQAPRPVYLWVHNDKVEIRDAQRFWGMDTYDVDEPLRRDTDEKACVLTIGPAGEKLVRIACIMNDGKMGRAAARCGLGAVMGFKRLKAIVVRGTAKIPVAEPKRLQEVIAKIYARSPVKKQDETIDAEVERLKGFLRVGGIPIKNWLEGTFEPGYALAEEIRHTKPMYCRRCPWTDMESKWTKDGERHMVWEHWAPLGAQCLVADAEALQKAYALCNRYGLDTISAGGVVSFAMECYEKGLITQKETGEIDLRWGNHEAMLRIVEQVGTATGFGAILGEGVKRAAEQVGGSAAEYAIHTKGLEFPAHDPRAGNILALNYATSNLGACHVEGSGNAAMFQADYEEKVPLVPVVPPGHYGEQRGGFETKGVGEHCAHTQDFGAMVNSVIVCNKLVGWRGVPPSQFVEMINAITGWNMDLAEFFKTGERIFNLKRMINVRRGISRKDDTLPPRILSHRRGSGGAAQHLPFLGTMLSDYYQGRGWTEEGLPSEAKLRELGLPECLAGLPYRQERG